MAMINSKQKTDGVQYVQPCKLVKMYGISRTTVWRLTKKMAATRKYANSFKRISPRLVLVSLVDFDEYINSLDLAYVKE
ncbi:hypothetical protein [Veillonella magna]|uniref:hypothetical protein n=1 Tax=Veillonella magna TaxID=464322 RepID=UPI0026654E82|nr:hypothetical protein [Veillonella magna]